MSHIVPIDDFANFVLARARANKTLFSPVLHVVQFEADYRNLPNSLERLAQEVPGLLVALRPVQLEAGEVPGCLKQTYEVDLHLLLPMSETVRSTQRQLTNGRVLTELYLPDESLDMESVWTPPASCEVEESMPNGLDFPSDFDDRNILHVVTTLRTVLRSY